MPGGKRDRQAIADTLRAKIEEGVYPPGGLVPSENQLAQEYGVAKMTARSALDLLKAEGLLIARRGSGTRVREFRPIYRHAGRRLSSQRWGTGQAIWSADASDRSLQVDQVNISEQPASSHVARVLDLQVGELVCVRERRFVLDGKPVMLATSYLPATLVANTAITEPDTGPGGTYARLAEIGHAPAHFAERLRARMPMQVEATQLELPSGTPVVQVTRVARTANGTAVEVNEMVMDASAYVFEYDIDA
jgi:GntR family transcriptional regulator